MPQASRKVSARMEGYRRMENLGDNGGRVADVRGVSMHGEAGGSRRNKQSENIDEVQTGSGLAGHGREWASGGRCSAKGAFLRTGGDV